MRQELACDFYIPAQPKASVVIVHGMAEHRQRYDKFAQFLEQNGYAVALYDLPGHGGLRLVRCERRLAESGRQRA